MSDFTNMIANINAPMVRFTKFNNAQKASMIRMEKSKVDSQIITAGLMASASNQQPVNRNPEADGVL